MVGLLPLEVHNRFFLVCLSVVCINRKNGKKRLNCDALEFMLNWNIENEIGGEIAIFNWADLFFLGN